MASEAGCSILECFTDPMRDAGLSLPGTPSGRTGLR